uniref:NADPH--cytochrome P450 reductase n=1 Tax=Romanomermis culicivorax TaxID=13658 RepID=A0A915L6H1_ROMCU
MFATLTAMIPELGLVDYAALLAALAGFYYLFFRKTSQHEYEFTISQIKPVSTTNGVGSPGGLSLADAGGFVAKMKATGRHVVVFYGSQTGTAEDLANRLAKDAQRYGMQKGLALDPEECDVEEIVRLNEIPNSLLILCLATYGEGDPTDNAQELYDFLKSGDADLTGVNYAVFGLGNKTYEHFNAMGKFTDQRLAEMGARRVYELGLGDDDGNLEEDFMLWRENFWPAVCELFDIKTIGEDISTRQYKLTVHDATSVAPEKIFRGEIARLNSYLVQKPPYDLKNPFLARVKENRELHTGGDRSCRHIELDISNSRIRYEAGDHVAVFPSNDPKLVEKFGEILNVDLDTLFTLTSLDEDAGKKFPFCCPCTYRTALTHYVDIVAPPKINVIKEIAEYCTNAEEKAFLLSVTSTKEESRKKFFDQIVNDHRTILDLMQDLPSCRPPLDHLLELMPRLQARYYSISSSPKEDQNVISITPVVIKYTSKIGREVNGVATRYLAAKKVTELNPSPGSECPFAGAVPPTLDNAVKIQRLLDEKVPIFVRKSQLRLPRDPKTPIIMIGPGTGLAPFRGFLQDRRAQMRREPEKPLGDATLYFGCRNRRHDFIYREELESHLADGTLRHLYVAPSREQPEVEKTYVQHLLRENGEATWRLISGERGGHVYICGDAKNMARDVMDTFLDIFCQYGGMDREQAQSYMKKMETQKRYQADVWS